MNPPSIKKLKGRTTKNIFVGLTESIKKNLQAKGIKEEETQKRVSKRAAKEGQVFTGCCPKHKCHSRRLLSGIQFL